MGGYAALMWFNYELTVSIGSFPIEENGRKFAKKRGDSPQITPISYFDNRYLLRISSRCKFASI